MALVGKLRTVEGDRVGFWCLGCEEMHVIRVGAGAWSFNGNYDAPTFTPSVLTRSGHYVSEWKPGDHCWCSWNQEAIENGKEPSPFACSVCHLHVTNGKIQYLNDCTHKYAGQTVQMIVSPEMR